VSLLSLVDQLIGNVLQGNIYNNNNNYVNHLGTLVNPKTKISDMATPDPIFTPNQNGPLNVKKDQVSSAINPNLGISQPPFLSTTGFEANSAARTPDSIRSKIYQPNGTPPDVGGQLNTVAQSTIPERPEAVLSTQMNDKQRLSTLAVEPNLGDLKNNLYDNGLPSLVRGGPYALTEGFVGPLRNFDIFAIAHWVRNIGSEISFLPKFTNNATDKAGSFQGPLRNHPPGGPNGAETIIKSTQWLASNLLLASLNMGDTQAYGPLNLVWNPLSLLTAGALPARGISPTERPTIGNMVSTYKDNVETSVMASQLSNLNPLGERLLVIRNGLYSQIAPVKRLQQLRSPVMPPGFIGNLNGQLTTIDDEISLKTAAGTPGSVSSITDGKTDQAYAGTGVHTNLYNQERKYGLDTAIFPLEKIEARENEIYYPDNGIPDLKVQTLFQGKPFPGAGFLGTGNDLTFIAKPLASFINKRGISAQDTPNNVDVAFSVEDEEGTLKKTIDDDKNYLPFMFQDLRDETEQFMYLRAFLKSLTETFTPEWNEDRYYGRTEPVPIYKGTIRTINLTFNMVAWGPKDLPVLYKKLQKLQSMVYPLYDDQGFLKAGPIIKMRVGDLIASGKTKGLPGYLTSLDLNYDNSIWNIKQDFKVPRNIEVSLGFTALHETNPGLYKDKDKLVFGTATFKKENDSYKIDTISPENIRKIFQSVKDIK
jgi:hypothetical protein